MRDRSINPQKPFGVLVTTLKVVSESDPDKTYDVQLPSCTCPAFRYRVADRDRNPYGAPFCKHLRMAMESVFGWRDPAELAPETDLADAII